MERTGEIRETFNIQKSVQLQVALCLMDIFRNHKSVSSALVPLFGKVIGFQAFKDDVREVRKAMSGMNLEGFNDIKIGDNETYVMEEVAV